MFRKTETAAPCFLYAVLGALALLPAYTAFLCAYWLVCHAPGLTLCLLVATCFALARHWDCRTWAEAARERTRQVDHETAIECGLSEPATVESRRTSPRLLCLPRRAVFTDEPGECDPCGRF